MHGFYIVFGHGTMLMAAVSGPWLAFLRAIYSSLRELGLSLSRGMEDIVEKEGVLMFVCRVK